MKMNRKITLLAAAVAGAFGISASASAADNVIKIGFITDMSGVYADFDGPGGTEAIKLAIADFGGAIYESLGSSVPSTLTNVTIDANGCNAAGGGIFLPQTYGFPQLIMNNSIVANNQIGTVPDDDPLNGPDLSQAHFPPRVVLGAGVGGAARLVVAAGAAIDGPASAAAEIRARLRCLADAGNILAAAVDL